MCRELCPFQSKHRKRQWCNRLKPKRRCCSNPIFKTPVTGFDVIDSPI
jgi:hypothetical protein